MSMDIAAAMEYNRLVLKDSISTTITQKRLKILRKPAFATIRI